MNWGILSLLGMIVVVLGGVAGFFIFLARRSAVLAAKNPDSLVATSLTIDSDVEWNGTEDWQAQPLASRGGLKRVSALARKRSRCGRPHPEPGRLSVPPPRG
jgi:hypothetical protein